VLGKLVIEDMAQLKELEEIDVMRLVGEGDLVNTTTRDWEDCDGVKEELQTYRFYVIDDGKEVAKEMEVSKIIDMTTDTMQMTNRKEPWIVGHVFIRPYLNCFDQEDEFLIGQLRDNHLHLPSKEKYNFTSNSVLTSGQFGQPVYIDMVIFKGQVKNGFYIEAGADDFETDSNTLLFEIDHGWQGLLVEPNPTIYPKGLLKQRKAWASTSCLGTQKRPHTTQFTQKTVEGGMAGLLPEKNHESYDMQCFPLYSLLMASGNRTVNYLSLDIEGAEFQVLQTIPWDKVDIEVISLETNHAGEVFPGSQEEVREYLTSQGYVLVNTVEIDDIFVRGDLLDGKYSPDREAEKKFFQEYFEDKNDNKDESIEENKEELSTGDAKSKLEL